MHFNVAVSTNLNFIVHDSLRTIIFKPPTFYHFGDGYTIGSKAKQGDGSNPCDGVFAFEH
jgi:hypothetical protein